MKSNVTAIVLAAGQGKRMNSDVHKQYLLIDGKPVIYYSLRVFEESVVDDIILVVGDGEKEYCQKEIVQKYGFKKVTKIVSGGAERYNSVHNGLIEAEGAKYVMIHDGARPFVTINMINDSIDAVIKYNGCTVGMPVKDTIKIVDKEGFSVNTPDRSLVWQIQTPQTFNKTILLDAYYKMFATGDTNVTDDTMIVERYQTMKIKVLEGAYTNIKITTPEDLKIAENFLKKGVDISL